jgi:hypothetical protein
MAMMASIPPIQTFAPATIRSVPAACPASRAIAENMTTHPRPVRAMVVRNPPRLENPSGVFPVPQ